MRDLPNIRRAVNGMKWAIVPEKLEMILDVLETRIAKAAPFTAEEISQRMQAANVETPKPHAVARSANVGGSKVAVLPLTGLIVPKSSMVNGESMPSGTSC